MLLSLTACNALTFNPHQAFDQLAEAKTSEAEADAFREIWNKADELGFSAYKEDGEALPVSSPDFPALLYAIDLRVNGETHHPVLIEPENIYILMRE